MDKSPTLLTPKNLDSSFRVLFTGGGGAGSEALARLFHNRYKAFFADADEKSKPYSICHKQWFKIPNAKDPRFIEGLSKVCELNNINLVVPTVDEELNLIASESDKLNCEILLPPEKFIKRNLDKLNSNNFLEKAGILVPWTRKVATGNIEFPCILKPRTGRGSINVSCVSSQREIDAHIIVAGSSKEDFVLQELLLGNEYTVMIAADKKGHLKAVVPVLIDRKRGITIRAATIYDQKVIEACVAIHNSDPVPGCYNVQLIKDKRGFVKPFEINPRISTTACLCFAAGVDFIGVYMGDQKNGVVTEFQSGIQLRRSWYNEFIS